MKFGDLVRFTGERYDDGIATGGIVTDLLFIIGTAQRGVCLVGANDVTFGWYIAPDDLELISTGHEYVCGLLRQRYKDDETFGELLPLAPLENEQ